MVRIEENKFNDFFNMPLLHYGKTLPYVSQFKPDMKRFLSRANPIFSTGQNFKVLIAYRDQKPVARLVVHTHDESNLKFNLKKAYFGYFECTDDNEAVDALFLRAENWARSQGMSELSGNFNLTAMQQIGIVTEGFQNLTYTDQVYNSPHVPAQLDRLGYSRIFPMTTFELDLTQLDPEMLIRQKDTEKLQNPRYKFRKVLKKGLNESLEQIRVILNEGFADNPMFVPVTSQEFMFQAKDMMWIIDERLSYICDVDGAPAATSVVIPDLNPLLARVGSNFSWRLPFEYMKYLKNRNRALLIFGSVKKEFHELGLGTPTFYLQLKALKDAGYKTLGITWVSESNPPALKHMQRIGATVLHKTCLFSKEI